MEKTIDEIIDFFLFEKGESILVNDISIKAVILDAVEKINEYENKIINCKYEIQTGDIIEYRNGKYIIESQIVKNQNSYTARMRKCEYKVAFNWSGIVKWFDCIIESKTVDVDSNRYISYPVNRIKISLKSNEASNKIDINMRCINTGRAWKVVGLDKTRSGLISLICDLDCISEKDNAKLEIANYYSYIYTLSIYNGDTVQINPNNTVQLHSVLKLNDRTVESPTILYSSSNIDIAGIDANGLITANALGSCTIAAKWAENAEIFDTTTINVIDQPVVETYTLELIGNREPDTEITISEIKTYTCIKRSSNGTTVDGEFDFSIIAGTTPNTKYTFTVLNDTQCSIKGNGYPYCITLRAQDMQNSNLYIEKSIRLKGSF